MTRSFLPPSAPTVAPGAFGYNRGVVRQNYAFLPPEGILQSRLPAFERTVVHFQTAPAMGAKFAQALLVIDSGGGTRKVLCNELQHFFYILSGTVEFTLDGAGPTLLAAGGYAYLPPRTGFSLRNEAAETARVLWLKRPYAPIEDFAVPKPIISHVDAVEAINHGGNVGRSWKHLLPRDDLRFDMEINILGFAPGAHFPAVETHIMEHGLYMLKGQGIYLLDNQWHETWQDDFIWMGPFLPHLFYPTGWSDSAYLLYKDVNRDVDFAA